MSMRLAAVALPLLLAAAPAAADPVPVQPTVVPVPLDAGDPARDRLGSLRFLGGVALASDDKRAGELSSLRWDSGTLVAVSDNAIVVRLRPIERRGRLVGARLVSVAPLPGPDGRPLALDEAENDAEALTRDGQGGWLVAFEGDHRILRYRRLDRAPVGAADSPTTLLGELGSNEGVEAMAGDAHRLFACAERQPAADRPNCVERHDGKTSRLAVMPPEPLAGLGGVPTDADTDDKGRRYVLFRSFSPADGPGAAVVRVERDGRTTPLAVLRPPLTLDNMEGLAVRRERGRTMLYLVSDDNGSAKQRTLLMKFAVED